MFNWNADTAKGESVVSDHFRMYWAITIPLTALVLAFYGIWLQRSRLSNLKLGVCLRGIRGREKASKDIEKND